MTELLIILGIVALVVLGIKLSKSNKAPQGPVTGTPGVDQPSNPEEPIIE
jgi:hypothetical protein